MKKKILILLMLVISPFCFIRQVNAMTEKEIEKQEKHIRDTHSSITNECEYVFENSSGQKSLFKVYLHSKGKAFVAYIYQWQKDDRNGYVINGNYDLFKKMLNEENKCPPYVFIDLNEDPNDGSSVTGAYEFFGRNMEDINNEKAKSSCKGNNCIVFDNVEGKNASRYTQECKIIQNDLDSRYNYIEKKVNLFKKNKCDKKSKRGNKKCEIQAEEINKEADEAAEKYQEALNEGCFEEKDHKNWKDFFKSSKIDIDTMMKDDGADLADLNSICTNSNYRTVTKIIGWVIGFGKILVPLLFVIFGIAELYKAVIAGKDDALKKSIKSLIIRVIAAVVIFFLPALIHYVFEMLDDWTADYNSNFTTCTECLLTPENC